MLESWLQFRLDYLCLWSGLAFLITATVVYLLHITQRIRTSKAIEIAQNNPDSKEISDWVPWNILVGVFFVCALHCWFYTMKMSFVKVDNLFILNNFLRICLYLLYIHFYKRIYAIHRIKPIINDKLMAAIVIIAAIVGCTDLMKTIYSILSVLGIAVTINVVTVIYGLAKKNKDSMLFSIGSVLALNTVFKLIIFSYRYGGISLFFDEESIRESVFLVFLTVSQCIPLVLAYLFWRYGRKKLGKEAVFFKGFFPLIIVFMAVSGFFISEMYTTDYIESEKQSLIRVGQNLANALNTENFIMDKHGKLKSDTGQYEALEKLLHSYARHSDKISAIVSYWKQDNGDILIGPGVYRPECGFIAEPWVPEKDPLNLISDCLTLNRAVLRNYETIFAGKSTSVFVPIFADFERNNIPKPYFHRPFAVLSVVVKDYIWNNDQINKRLSLFFSLAFIMGVPFLAYAASITRKDGFKLPFNTSNTFTLIVIMYIVLSSVLIARFANETSIAERKDSFFRSAEGKASFVSEIFQKSYSNIIGMAKEIQIRKGFDSVEEFKTYVKEKNPALKDKICLLAVDENNQVHDYQNAGMSFKDEECKNALKEMFRTISPQAHCHHETVDGVRKITNVQIIVPLRYGNKNRINEILCYNVEFQNYIDIVMPSIYKVSDYLGFDIFDIESIDNSAIMCYPSSSSSSSSSSLYNAIYPLCFFNKTFGVSIYPIGGNFFDSYQTYIIYLSFGFILAILVTIFIVSAQKKQEALEKIVLEKSNSIRLQDEYVRNITSNLPLISFRFSVENGLLAKAQFLSAAVYDYSGYTSQAFISGEKDIFDFVHVSDREKLVSDVIQSIYEKKNLAGEYNFIDFEGKKYCATVTGSPITDNEGKVQWFDGFLLNIQNRKDVELSILKNKENLESLNTTFQSAKLHAEEMAKKAEKANEAKDQFLANMSHEIRTPMNAILGMSNLLLTTRLTEEQKQYAEIVNSSTGNLLNLIKDVLDISKLDSSGVELENVSFNLHDVVDETLAMLAIKANEKKIELNMFLDKDVPVGLIGDGGRLRQVLINLINNAIKFTSVGGVSVKISKLEETEKDTLVKFIVSDTGLGIAKENIDKLFKPFSQAEASTTRKFGGTGLGLMISKQIVELFGGQIGVESKEGHGSDFWFTAKFEKQPGFVAKKYEGKDLTGLRVLVVDDYQVTRDLIGDLLNEWGCRVIRAENALLALQQMNNAVEDKDPFAVVLLDSEMPVMDGNQFAELIKSNPRFNDSYIVMMTNNAHYSADELTKYGLSTSIRKPIRYNVLHNRLSEVVTHTLKRRETLEPVITMSNDSKRVSEKKILLVEDNKTNQVVALALLKKFGYKADVANDGSEGIKALAKTDYDLVFMDCQMPIIDGFEATRRIRKGDADVINPKVKIVAMTANAMSGDKERCLKAGMNDYISKPVQPKLLKEMLEKYLS